jgi:hypothetical protein
LNTNANNPMKTEKTMKTKSSTATKAASTAKAVNGLETSRTRKRTLTVAALEPPTAHPARTEMSSPQEISNDMIAVRAFIIWEQQGRPHGRDVANWLLAESQLKQEQSFSA